MTQDTQTPTDPSQAPPGTRAPAEPPSVRRLLHRWEAASAVLLANNPTPAATLGLARAMPVLLRWRAHPAGALVAACARHPQRTAILDDDGGLSFLALDEETNALARSWRTSGLGAGTTIGILAAPGRMFLEASLAAQKLGADVVYLNAAFSGPQVADVVQGEAIDVLVHDAEHAEQAGHAATTLVDDAAMRALVDGAPSRPVRPPRAPGRVVVMTSGTTGRPKGARRAGRQNTLDAAGLLACLPVMSGDRFLIAAPLFHGLGLLGATLGLALGSTVGLRSRFDPEQTLRDIAATRATVLVAVPVMLQRILTLPERKRRVHDVSSLRVVLCGGSALGADLAERFMDEFGDVLYNFYGSTEAGWAT
ncbi:MAG: AMP-binding protein, partial [Solirubrobacteraceae bacterium]